jgi:hypothetical protein
MIRYVASFCLFFSSFLLSFSLFGNPNSDPKIKKCLNIYNTGVKFHRAGRGYYHEGFSQFKRAKKESSNDHRVSLLQGAYDNSYKGVQELTIAINILTKALAACPSDIHPKISKLIEDSRNDQSTIGTFMLGIRTQEPKIVEPEVK